MTKNKIMQTFLTPYYVTTLSILGIMITSGALLAERDYKRLPAQEYKQNVTWQILVIAVFAMFLALERFRIGAAMNRFAKTLTRSYLQDVLKNNSDLEMFSALLDNPKAIVNIATVITNSLSPEERKRIEKILAEVKSYKTKQEHVGQIKKAFDQVLGVIKEHAAMHPEFINQLRIAMARADSVYAMPTQIYTPYTR